MYILFQPLKIAIKIPFIAEVEINFETDWNRRR